MTKRRSHLFYDKEYTLDHEMIIYISRLSLKSNFYVSFSVIYYTCRHDVVGILFVVYIFAFVFTTIGLNTKSACSRLICLLKCTFIYSCIFTFMQHKLHFCKPSIFSNDISNFVLFIFYLKHTRIYDRVNTVSFQIQYPIFAAIIYSKNWAI